MYQIHFKQAILNFWTKFVQERYFCSKTEKVNITNESHISKLVSWYQISVLIDNFDFLSRFIQKGFFWSKTEKLNTTYFLHNSAYSNLSSAKFQLKLTILIFLTKFEMVTVKNFEKYHHLFNLPILVTILPFHD